LEYFLGILKPAQFFHPGLAIFSMSIVIAALLDRIEHPRFSSGVITDPRHILPVAPVGADIVIDQHTFVPFCSQLPVDPQVLGQITGYVLPGSVARVAREQQFSLAGVNETCSRGAA
jgi:hypothetical protein